MPAMGESHNHEQVHSLHGVEGMCQTYKGEGLVILVTMGRNNRAIQWGGMQQLRLHLACLTGCPDLGLLAVEQVQWLSMSSASIALCCDSQFPRW